MASCEQMKDLFKKKQSEVCKLRSELTCEFDNFKKKYAEYLNKEKNNFKTSNDKKLLACEKIDLKASAEKYLKIKHKYQLCLTQLTELDDQIALLWAPLLIKKYIYKTYEEINNYNSVFEIMCKDDPTALPAILVTASNPIPVPGLAAADGGSGGEDLFLKMPDGDNNNFEIPVSTNNENTPVIDEKEDDDTVKNTDMERQEELKNELDPGEGATENNDKNDQGIDLVLLQLPFKSVDQYLTAESVLANNNLTENEDKQIKAHYYNEVLDKCNKAIEAGNSWKAKLVDEIWSKDMQNQKEFASLDITHHEFVNRVVLICETVRREKDQDYRKLFLKAFSDKKKALRAKETKLNKKNIVSKEKQKDKEMIAELLKSNEKK